MLIQQYLAADGYVVSGRLHERGDDVPALSAGASAGCIASSITSKPAGAAITAAPARAGRRTRCFRAGEGARQYHAAGGGSAAWSATPTAPR